jgi:hypothetical protein
MATNLIGIPANKLILNSTNFRREIVGLERINDVYTSRTEDAADFAEIIKNGASHSTVMAYLSPTPSASDRFANMLVENVESSNEVGGITEFNVTYVGLYRDLKPKPLITLQPVDQYAFNPYSVTVQFIDFVGDVGSTDEIIFLKKYSRRQPLPIKINGYALPQSSVAPFAGQISSKLIQTIQGSQFFAQALQEYFVIETLSETNKRNETNYPAANQGFSFPFTSEAPAPAVEYKGLIISGVSYQRYGKFAHTIITASDSARSSIFVNINGKTTIFTSLINYEF